MQAIIISIGDELVLGQVVDTNAAWLSARLVEAGVVPLYHRAVQDNLEAIVEAVKSACAAADLVVISGGLGPTRDDLTRQAVARAAGVSLLLHEPSLEALERFFKNRGRTMGDNNRIQALFPNGADVLDNPIGTAPGFKIRIMGATVVVTPGVPVEMKLMFERHIGPMLAAGAKHRVLTMKLNAIGLGESLVDEKLGALMRRDRNPLVGTTVAGGVIAIRIRGEFDDAAEGARAMQTTADEIRRCLGEAVFGEGEESLAEVVGKMLLARHKTLVVAESCTAGLLAAMLTETPGASKYFTGGWVVYANALKTDALAVPAELIQTEGAVSEAVARKMTEGALTKGKADYALAITGVAGPEGGSSEKPVGTVWIAMAEKMAAGMRVTAEKNVFPGDRVFIRERAAKAALNILRLGLIQTGS